MGKPFSLPMQFFGEENEAWRNKNRKFAIDGGKR